MKLDKKQFVSDLKQLVADKVPFLHQGRDPYAGGLDCLYAPVWAALQQGARLPDEMVNPEPYFEGAHKCELIEETMRRHMTEVPPEEAQAGDVYLFRIAKRQRHIGVQITNDHPPLLFHMVARAPRRAVEMPFSPEWQIRLIAIFRFPDFAEGIN